MEIEFDAEKDAQNITKHGLSLALAKRFDWSGMLCHPDDRRDYGELREVAYGVIGERLHVVVFVQRGAAMRIISLRRANNREARRYAESSDH